MPLTESDNFLLYLNKDVILADTHQILFKYNKKLLDSVNSIAHLNYSSAFIHTYLTYNVGLQMTLLFLYIL